MTIDIGTAVDGMTVVSISFDPPEVWLSCGHGHRVWATPEMLEGGLKLLCAECAREAKQHVSRQERSKLADDLIAAGRGSDAEFEELIEAERKENL
jgi:predicted metal-dependent enzyme (double-stranded beta helix superfamily)